MAPIIDKKQRPVSSHKSFKPKKDDETPPRIGGCVKVKNATTNFRGEKRTNDTHASTTDPDARLYKKSAGSASKLGYLGHVMTENRNGLKLLRDANVCRGNLAVQF